MTEAEADRISPEMMELMLGRTEVYTRWRPEGRDLVGEGRTRSFNQYGALVDDTGWESTGVRLVAPPEEVDKPWWRFWK